MFIVPAYSQSSNGFHGRLFWCLWLWSFSSLPSPSFPFLPLPPSLPSFLFLLNVLYFISFCRFCSLFPFFHCSIQVSFFFVLIIIFIYPFRLSSFHILFFLFSPLLCVAPSPSTFLPCYSWFLASRLPPLVCHLYHLSLPPFLTASPLLIFCYILRGLTDQPCIGLPSLFFFSFTYLPHSANQHRFAS